MSFADPQSITINAVPYTLPRVSTGDLSSKYQTSDGLVAMPISHTMGKRYRHQLRVDHKKIAADPLTAENAYFSMSAYLVVDRPLVGYTVTEAKQVIDGLTAYLTASSGAKVTQLLGFES